MTTEALASTDPTYVEVRAALDRHAHELPADSSYELFCELLNTVVEDRLRQAGPLPSMADFFAGLSAVDRMTLTDDTADSEQLDPTDSTEDVDPPIDMWVTSGRSPTGVYTTVIEIGKDHSYSLMPHEVDSYSNALFTAVAYAEYDAAVLSQLRRVRSDAEPLPAEYLVGTIVEFRNSRPPLNRDALRPLLIRPSVSAVDGRPYLTARISGTKIKWRWEPAAVYDHIQHVHDASVAADLDAAYRRYLMGVIGLDARTAEATVEDVGRHRFQRDH